MGKEIAESLFLPRFPAAVATRADALCQRLAAQEMRVVTAESCTGGLLAASLSRSLGSARCLVGGFVTYRPSQKIAALGVPEDLIAERTVYDPEVSLLMATGALKAAPEADLALAITGVAGPDADQGKPAGLVFITAALRDRIPKTRECHFAGGADEVITDTLRTALEMGIAAVEGSGGKD